MRAEAPHQPGGAGAGRIDGGAAIIPLPVRRRMRSCLACQIRLPADSPGHHRLCTLCYRGAQLYRAVRAYLQVRR